MLQRKIKVLVYLIHTLLLSGALTIAASAKELDALVVKEIAPGDYRAVALHYSKTRAREPEEKS